MIEGPSEVQTRELRGRPVALLSAKPCDLSLPSTELSVIVPWFSARAVEAARNGDVHRVNDGREGPRRPAQFLPKDDHKA